MLAPPAADTVPDVGNVFASTAHALLTKPADIRPLSSVETRFLLHEERLPLDEVASWVTTNA
jgi:hypothetical protein